MMRIQKKQKRHELIGIWLQLQYPNASFARMIVITIIFIMRIRIPKISNDEDPFLEKNKRRQDLIGISLQSQHLISSSGSDRLVVTNDFNPYMYKVSGSWRHTFMCMRATWPICRHATSLSFTCVLHDAFMCVTWFIHLCDLTHWYVWHDSLIVWHDSSMCVTWPIDMCDMTHSYMWHDSMICEIWSIDLCDMAHSYAWHDSLICVTWLIHTCDMTHSYVWHDSRYVDGDSWSCDMTHSHACDMTYS